MNHVAGIHYVAGIFSEEWLLEINYRVKQEIDWGGASKKRQKYVDVDTIETCPICQEGDCEIKTICNHSFCETCLNTWLHTHNSCPYCRQIVKHTTMHRLRLKTKKTPLQQLKQVCKNNNIKNYSHLKKEQIVQLLREKNLV